MTDSTIGGRAQLIVDKLLSYYGGDRDRAFAHAKTAAVLADTVEIHQVSDAVLSILRPPTDTFPADLLDEFISDALAVLDPGPVTITPELRGKILKSILRLSREAEARYSSLLDAAAALRKFKSFVHTYLDSIGVPADPFPEENAKHGCRISGRLQWLNERRMTEERLKPLVDCYEAAVRGDSDCADELTESVESLQRLVEGKPL
jgi:hypothetical protein